MRARTGTKGPEGAVRCYKLAPVTAPDAFEYVRQRMERRRWTVLEEGASIRLPFEGSDWVLVDVWAIPPAHGPTENTP